MSDYIRDNRIRMKEAGREEERKIRNEERMIRNSRLQLLEEHGRLFQKKIEELQVINFGCVSAHP